MRHDCRKPSLGYRIAAAFGRDRPPSRIEFFFADWLPAVFGFPRCVRCRDYAAEYINGYCPRCEKELGLTATVAGVRLGRNIVEVIVMVGSGSAAKVYCIPFDSRTWKTLSQKQRAREVVCYLTDNAILPVHIFGEREAPLG